MAAHDIEVHSTMYAKEICYTRQGELLYTTHTHTHTHSICKKRRRTVAAHDIEDLKADGVSVATASRHEVDAQPRPHPRLASCVCARARVSARVCTCERVRVPVRVQARVNFVGGVGMRSRVCGRVSVHV